MPISKRLQPVGFPTVLSNPAMEIHLGTGSEFGFEGQIQDEQLPPSLDPETGAKYLAALKADEGFLRKHGYEIPSLSDITDVREAHALLRAARVGHLGLRDIVRNPDGEVRIGGVTSVPHPAYRMFNSSTDEALQVVGANTGSCVALITNEGSGTPFLIIQDRGPGNSVYGGHIPGASAAGLIPAKGLPKTGTVDVLKLAKRNTHSETREELGFGLDNPIEFSAIVVDLLAYHAELAFISRSSLSLEEMRLKAQQNGGKANGVAFPESFIGLPCTISNLRSLIQLNSPMPPTHWGSFIGVFAALLRASGKYRESDISVELNWMLERIGDSYERINSLTRSGIYHPNLSAVEQGLPPVRAEFEDIYGKDGFEYVEVI